MSATFTDAMQRTRPGVLQLPGGNCMKLHEATLMMVMMMSMMMMVPDVDVPDCWSR